MTPDCQHGPHEDCMFCAVCGRCSETLDDDDICDECRSGQPISATRAAEIIAQHEAVFGSDTSQFMTAAEESAVRLYWLALPHNSTFRATIYQLARTSS